MPKVSIDYSKCVIYKIVNVDNDNLVYIGHTKNFTNERENINRIVIILMGVLITKKYIK